MSDNLKVVLSTWAAFSDLKSIWKFQMSQIRGCFLHTIIIIVITDIHNYLFSTSVVPGAVISTLQRLPLSLLTKAL